MHLTPYSDGSYGYRQDDTWYYVWMATDSNRISRVESSSWSPESRGLVMDAARAPMECLGGRPPVENEEVEAEGAMEAEDAMGEGEETSDTSSAIDDSESDSGSESSDSGSDGGGDSGGGDGGGGSD